MKLRYLEIVSHNVDAVCKAYEITHSASFSEPDESLGGARTCTLPDDSIVGIRDHYGIMRSPWFARIGS